MLKELKPYILSIFCSFCYAGYNIVSKVSLDDGMSFYVLVVYAHGFGTLATALLALLFERNNESKLSIQVWRNIFFLGLLGIKIYFHQHLLQPWPMQFQPSPLSWQFYAAGATLMTLYKGIVVISLPSSSGHHKKNQSAGINSTFFSDGDWIKGSVMLFISYLALAAFFILQTWTIKKYPAPITLTFLTCLAGTLLAAIMTAILDHKPSSWKLSWNISLLASCLQLYLQTLVIREKGPVFMTAFRPLATVIVAVMGLLILGEEIYLGRNSNACSETAFRASFSMTLGNRS
ncbi:hypothetical protein Patl1_33071 [Pistacia atlantica]|uniref:Uncharacterized protein n=1 Tax=Pistacia atlantica TaxID=434234 RepID=A0ACC1AND0_9ROSI|nr:hypothetical protein Patl1_33071 [Pistacia atlantica]